MTPIDVLVVINHLNLVGAYRLPIATAEMITDAGFLDANGDGFVTPLDALIIINFLNSVFIVPPTVTPAVAAEGEGESAALNSQKRLSTRSAGLFQETAPTARSVAMSLACPKSGEGDAWDTLVQPSVWPVAATEAAGSRSQQPMERASNIDRVHAASFATDELDLTDLGLESVLDAFAQDVARASS